MSETCFRAVEAYLRLLRTDLRINLELAFCLSLYGARNFVLMPTGKFHQNEVRPVSDNEIICPPAVIPAGGSTGRSANTAAPDASNSTGTTSRTFIPIGNLRKEQLGQTL